MQSARLCEDSIKICNKYDFEQTKTIREKLETIYSLCQSKIELYEENSELDFTTASGLSSSSQIFGEITIITRQETTVMNEIKSLIPNLPVDGVAVQK